MLLFSDLRCKFTVPTNYHRDTVLIWVLEDLKMFSGKLSTRTGYPLSKTKKPFGFMNLNLEDLIKLP